MLSSSHNYGFSKGERLDAELCNYVIYEGGTLVFDRYGNIVGDYPTESEAVEAVNEIAADFYDG
ncbi:MAG: hypothetical protein EOM40_12755 [Clostridia bacterium]|nr:hypothetical protein [Clostridia bacterium]